MELLPAFNRYFIHLTNLENLKLPLGISTPLIEAVDAIIIPGLY